MSENERRQRTISSTPRLTPDEVASRSFPTSFRGISETDVRAFLKRVAEELGIVRSREQELMATIDELEARLRTPRPLDEHELLDALGEETTRLLRSAREAAADIRTKAEERAARLVHDAHEESQRLRNEAEAVLGLRTQEAQAVGQGLLEEAEQRASDLMRVADERAVEVRAASDRYAEELRARVEREAASEIESARERGRSLVEEAVTLRQRVIEDLAGRRELLSGQLEELRTGRDGLLDAYRVVKRTFLEATEALAQVEAHATAGRTAAGSDPTDLSGALASEAEAARAAGLDAQAGAPTAADTEASAETNAAAGDDTTAPDADEPVAVAPVAVESVGGETAVTDPAVAGTEPASNDQPATDEAASGQPEVGDADESPGSNLADVDDLFARLRAGAEADVAAASDTSADAAAAAGAPSNTDAAAAGEETSAETQTEAAGTGAKARAETRRGGSATEAPAAADEAPAWLARRDELLAPLRVVLVRQVKLAIGNEQNEVLDRVRRHKGRLAAESALPEIAAQTEAWAAVLLTAASDAYRMGRGTSSDGTRDDDVAGDAPAIPDDLGATLARAMVEPLRDRLVSTIDGGHEPGETASQVAERIGARYREWKNRSAESSAEDALVAAYARGHYDAAADGSLLTWCVPPAGCCVDCADNALEPTGKGDDFPTGQAYPPAHPGCRCALTSDETQIDARESASQAPVESTSRG